jgi:hypothetical protein
MKWPNEMHSYFNRMILAFSSFFLCYTSCAGIVLISFGDLLAHLHATLMSPLYNSSRTALRLHGSSLGFKMFRISQHTQVLSKTLDLNSVRISIELLAIISLKYIGLTQKNDAVLKVNNNLFLTLHGHNKLHQQRELLMLAAGPRDPLPRWLLSRKRLSMCCFLRYPYL